MNGFLPSLLALSVVLTVCGGAALLFRLTRAGRCGRVMSAVWTIVLALAILPLRLPEAWLPMALVGETGSDALIELSPAVITTTPAVEASEGQFAVIERPAEPAQPVQIIEAPARLPAIPIGALLFAVWFGGAAVMLGLALRRNRRLNTMLRTCSQPCEDDEALATFVDLAHRAGLRRLPELRVLDAGIPIPPCTAGFFAPCVYLPAELPTAQVSRAAILAHELSHVCRRDIWRKLFALAVCSAHWFNPIAHAILPRVYEDLEPACDRDALRLLGGEPARIGYMQTLLEVASAPRASASHTPAAHGTLFFVDGNRAKSELKRRFISMKTRHTRIFSAIALLLICAMAITSATLFTACTSVAAEDSPLDPLAERIIRYTFDLAPDDEITTEMRKSITSLRLTQASISRNLEDDVERTREMRRSAAEYAAKTQQEWMLESLLKSHQNYDNIVLDDPDCLTKLCGGQILLDFTVNPYSLEPASVSYQAIHAKRISVQDKVILANGGATHFPNEDYDIFATIAFVRPRFFTHSMAATVTDAWTLNKLNAYYKLMDASDPSLTGDSRAYLLEAVPGCDVSPVMRCDPTASVDEQLEICRWLYESGYFAPQLSQDGVINTAALFAAFPKLETLELIGLTAEDDINAVTELPARGDMTPLTELIVRYYHDLGPDDVITEDMFYDITSLKLEVSSINRNLQAHLEALAQADQTDKDVVAAGMLLNNLSAGNYLLSFRVNYIDAPEGSYEALLAAHESFHTVPRHYYEMELRAESAARATSWKPSKLYTLTETTDGREVYVLKPDATYNDIAIIMATNPGVLSRNGLFLSSAEIDTSIFSVFPNLTTLELVGLTEKEAAE